MPAEHDKNLARAVVEEGLVGEDEVKVCLAEMERAESIGAVISLETVLVKKGLLTQEQIHMLLQNLRRKDVPSRLGGFEIIEPIGRGGMHAVYKARQVAMDRTVALKILSSEFTKEKRHVERLFEEARAAAQLNHVNIVQAIDAGEASGYYYFASEYVEGESVAERLRSERNISENDALAIAEQVCNALIHIHTAAGKIHGDIKPANIMLASNGVAKLVDLGLANSIRSAQGTIVCSPHYSAPERIKQSANIDFRSDIYSLGATIFHMITGKPPFTGSNAKAILSKHLTEPVPELAAAGTPPSRGLRTLVRKMLAKDPRDRHQTLDELLQDIKKLREPRVIRVEERVARPPKPQTNYEPLIIAIVVLVIAMGMAAAGYFVYSNLKTKPEEIVEQSGDYTVEHTEEAAAAEAYASVEAFAKTNPDDFQEIARRFEEVAANHAGTEHATKAAQRAEHFTRLHEQLAQANQTLQRVKEQAEALAEQQRYGDAIIALRGFPEEMKTTAISAELLEEETRLKERAERHVRELVARAEELAGQNEYLAAAELLETSRKFGFSDVTEKVEEMAAGYRNAAARLAEEEAEARFAHAYDSALISAMILSRGHRFDEAAAALDEFAARHKDIDLNKRFDGEFGAMRDEISSAAGTWAKIRRALQAKIGQQISLRVAGILLNGTLERVDGATLTISMRGNEITKKLSEINGEDALALAGLNGEGAESALKRMQFYLAASDLENALKEARLLGDEELFELWAARIAHRKKLLADYEVELQVRDTLGRVLYALDNGRTAQAFRLLDPLRENMPASPPLKDEIRDLLVQTEAALAVLWKIEHHPGQLLALIDTLHETFQWQDENACPKTVPCPDCDGKGFTTGLEQCPTCGGDGTNVCPMCRGRGTVRFRTVCPNCNGTGTVECETCHGKGVVERQYTCQTCRGTGEITCPICHGTGYKKPMPESYKSALHDMQVYNISREEVRKLFAE